MLIIRRWSEKRPSEREKEIYIQQEKEYNNQFQIIKRRNNRNYNSLIIWPLYHFYQWIKCHSIPRFPLNRKGNRRWWWWSAAACLLVMHLLLYISEADYGRSAWLTVLQRRKGAIIDLFYFLYNILLWLVLVRIFVVGSRNVLERWVFKTLWKCDKCVVVTWSFI